jgi:hypothetical protein
VNGSFSLPNARSFDSWLALRVGVAVIAIWHDIKKRFQFFLIELIFTFFTKSRGKSCSSAQWSRLYQRTIMIFIS